MASRVRDGRYDATYPTVRAGWSIGQSEHLFGRGYHLSRDWMHSCGTSPLCGLSALLDFVDLHYPGTAHGTDFLARLYFELSRLDHNKSTGMAPVAPWP